MSEPQNPQSPDQPDELQFATAEPAVTPTKTAAAPTAPSCIGCHQPIQDTYFTAGGKLICPGCHDKYVQAYGGGSGFGRLSKATLFGIVAGAAGALIWWGVRALTKANWGIVAVVVGFLVGGAVRAGSGGRGGKGYQFLAVLLTYLAIAGTYVPEVYRAVQNDAHHRASLGEPELPPVVTAFAVVVTSVGAPVLVGIHSIIGLFIVGFALWEAWKINARRQVTFAGPYSLRGGPAALPLPQPMGVRP